MKFNKIWEKLGCQTIKDLNKEAYVFIDGEKYKIEKIRYKDGIPVGFDVSEKKWHGIENKPEEDKWVIVRDSDGVEYINHKWNGMCWYSYVKNNDGTRDGWRSDVDVVSWRYE